MTLSYRIAASLLLLAAGSISTAAQAQQHRSYSRGFHGPNGRGVTQRLDIRRGDQRRVATRSLQTDRGRGITTQRDHYIAGGSFTGSTTRQLNNGKSWGVATNAYALGNGTANYERTYTGPNGKTATRTGTVGRW